MGHSNQECSPKNQLYMRDQLPGTELKTNGSARSLLDLYKRRVQGRSLEAKTQVLKTSLEKLVWIMAINQIRWTYWHQQRKRKRSGSQLDRRRLPSRERMKNFTAKALKFTELARKVMELWWQMVQIGKICNKRTLILLLSKDNRMIAVTLETRSSAIYNQTSWLMKIQTVDLRLTRPTSTEQQWELHLTGLHKVVNRKSSTRELR